MICLDRDILVKISEQDDAVITHLNQYRGQEVTIPALVAWESYRSRQSRTGMLQLQRSINEQIDRVIGFSDDTALEAAYLGERLDAQGVGLDTVDLLNLATAHADGGTFVTHNRTDFEREPIHDITDVDVVVTE